MGRDDKNTGGKNSASLPQTPKKQKIAARDMKEEIAKELAELRRDTGREGSGPAKRWP